MAGFSGIRTYNFAYQSGQNNYSTFRKAVSQATTAGVWFDLAMSSGNPAPIYYASSPLVGAALRQSTDGGLRHGSSVSPDYKFINRFLIMSTSATGLPLPFILCDYIKYYPFIDQSTNDVQLMDNTTPMPRYADGKGVQIMAVGTNASSGNLPYFTVSYTNSDGVSGRTTDVVRMNAATATGSLVSSSNGTAIDSYPFLPLQSGDLGVRSIDSVTFTSGTDVGLLCLVLVKPLITGCLLEQTAPYENQVLPDQTATYQIYDDACLNIICCPQGSLSGVGFHGEIETIWD